MWPFALFSAFSFTVPYLLVANLLGPEFPSLLGGLIGLAIVVSAAKRGWFLPSADELWDFEPSTLWQPDWSGTIEIEEVKGRARMGLGLAWTPDGIVGLLLVLTRLRGLPFFGWLNAWSVEWPDILGSGITSRFQPLFLPGTVFIVRLCSP